MSTRLRVMIELTEDEYVKYFKNPKEEYKSKTGKHRTITEIWQDQITAKEQYEKLNEEKSNKIELLFNEKSQLMDDIKKYVESAKMTCSECGHQGMSIKLDYEILAGWKKNKH